MIVFDAPTRKRYLFQLCDKNNDGKLTKNEFEILAIQILGIYVDEKTTKMLFPDDENITYEDFRDWLCGKVINGLSKLSEIKCKLLQKLRKVDNYPYMYIYNIYSSHIKCVLYINIVQSGLESFDKSYPPKFSCPICNKTSHCPKELSKHIVQCRIDQEINPE